MADQHNDNIPALANQIVNDVPDIKENLEFHKDCFQAITEGWSNTVTTSLVPNYVSTTADADSSVDVTGLTAGGLYIIRFALSMTDADLYLRFNNDSTATRYGWTYHYFKSSDATSVVSDASDAQIVLASLTSPSGWDYYNGIIFFAPLYGTNTKTLCHFDIAAFGAQDTGTSGIGRSNGTGYYAGDGSTNVTQFNILPSTGTFSGKVTIQRIG